MKQLVLNLMASGGAFDPFRKANRDKVLILMYHRFNKSDDRFSTSAHAFTQHLEYLKAHYTLVTVSQIAEHLRTGDTLPPSLAVITIDDGFRDAYEVAFPLLRRYNLPATLFAVTAFVDQKAWIWTDKLRFLTSHTTAEEFETSVNGHILRFRLNGAESRFDAASRMNEMLKQLADNARDETIAHIAAVLKMNIPELPPAEYAPLTWPQAREMDSNGVEIASHTLTHPILTKVSDELLRSELEDSRSHLKEMLGRESKSFCYPNGDYDERVVRAVERAGYDCAVSTKQGLNSKHNNLFSLQRIPAVCNFARFVKATSGFEQIQIRWRACPGDLAGGR